jgi:tRNA 2-selenouridine synthase SelU
MTTIQTIENKINVLEQKIHATELVLESYADDVEESLRMEILRNKMNKVPFLKIYLSFNIQEIKEEKRQLNKLLLKATSSGKHL